MKEIKTQVRKDEFAERGQPVRPRILFVVSVFWTFNIHRYSVARFLQANGYEVAVACADPPIDGEDEFGIRFFPIPVRRESLGPVALIKEIEALNRVLRLWKPTIIHAVALRMIMITGILKLFRPKQKVINAMAGMGTLFSGGKLSLKLRVVRRILCLCFRRFLKGEGVITLFQNGDDLEFAQSQGWIDNRKVFIVRGVGVPLNYARVPERNSLYPVIFLFVGRLLIDKGVRDLIGAGEILAKAGANFRLRIVGKIDPSNPNSLTESEVKGWKTYDWLDFHGWMENVTELIKSSDVVVLPSYREGLPKALVEAGAVGRAIITCDTMGCREVVVDGLNGFLVPVQRRDALADAMKKFLVDQSLIEEMGLRSFERVKEFFCEEVVHAGFLAVHKNLINGDQRCSN